LLVHNILRLSLTQGVISTLLFLAVAAGPTGAYARQQEQITDSAACITRVESRLNAFYKPVPTALSAADGTLWIVSAPLDRYASTLTDYVNSSAVHIDISGCPDAFTNALVSYLRDSQAYANSVAAHPAMAQLYLDFGLFILNHHQLMADILQQQRVPDANSDEGRELYDSAGPEAMTLFKRYVGWRLSVKIAEARFNQSARRLDDVVHAYTSSSFQ
jgi:hypothetical protein